MQSIFRSASRRETLGRHSKGRRRGGGLKMDWTKPRTARGLCVLIAGWISGEVLKGPEAGSVGDFKPGARQSHDAAQPIRWTTPRLFLARLRGFEGYGNRKSFKINVSA